MPGLKSNPSNKSSLELSFEALNSCNTYIDILNENIENLVALYANAEYDSATKSFGEFIELLDLYIQLFGQIYKVIKRNFSHKIKYSESIQKLEIHLLSIVKAILLAKENNDNVMLSDLLEYELIDNLTQWKIKIIPFLKSLEHLKKN